LPDQQIAIDTAVNCANQNSDVQIAGVKHEVEDATHKLGDRLDAVGGQVSKNENDISGEIGKVIMPLLRHA
jgi:hypothetical protein